MYYYNTNTKMLPEVNSSRKMKLKTLAERLTELFKKIMKIKNKIKLAHHQSIKVGFTLHQPTQAKTILS